MKMVIKSIVCLFFVLLANNGYAKNYNSEIKEFLIEVAEAIEKAEKPEELEKFFFDGYYFDENNNFIETRKKFAVDLFYNGLTIRYLINIIKTKLNKYENNCFKLDGKFIKNIFESKKFPTKGLNRKEIEKLRKENCSFYIIGNLGILTNEKKIFAIYKLDILIEYYEKRKKKFKN